MFKIDTMFKFTSNTDDGFRCVEFEAIDESHRTLQCSVEIQASQTLNSGTNITVFNLGDKKIKNLMLVNVIEIYLVCYMIYTLIEQRK